MNNSDFLKKQYRTSDNLNARAQLHEKFSTSKYRWQIWVFDQIQSDKKLSVLELGCGTGELWLQNKSRINCKWNITLSDFSRGMVEKAQQKLAGIKNIEYKVFGVESIPFPANFFDMVIANHVLFHAQNVEQAIGEIARILKDDGVFYAATNGEAHTKEIFDIIFQTTGQNHKGEFSSFTAENGAELLSKQFPKVAVRSYPDSLMVTEMEPLFEYIMSMGYFFTGSEKNAIKKKLQQMFLEKGVVKITKKTALFVAQKQ